MMKFTFKEKIDLIKYQLKYHTILSKEQKERIVGIWREPSDPEEFQKMLEDYYKDHELTRDYVARKASEYSIDKKDLKVLKKCKKLKFEDILKYKAVFIKYFGDLFFNEYDYFVVRK